MKAFDKNNPFKTPEGYFESLNDKLVDSLSRETSNLPNNQGFVVPDAYFESIKSKITSKLDVPDTKVITLHPYKKYYYAVASIAAVILLVFGLTYNTSQTLTFETLAESDIENYFENNNYDLSAFEIAEVIALDDLEINDILTNHIEDENLFEYLNENTNNFEELNLEDYE